MIGYVTLGTNDLPRAVKYYDALFDSVGISRSMQEDGRYVVWAPTPDAPALSIVVPFDKESATVGNGVMVALLMESIDKVNVFYQKALELGGNDEGKPGFRPEGENNGFYCAYFRDLDGNKLNAFCVVS